jgi:hypothetical protein
VKRSVLGWVDSGLTGWRRPFMMNFTVCQPCGGKPNEIYSKETCTDGMRHALTFANDQVLHAYGFRHEEPLSDDVRPLPFGYRAAAPRGIEAPSLQPAGGRDVGTAGRRRGRRSLAGMVVKD